MDINKFPEKEQQKIKVIKSVFAGNVELLKILRKIVLGIELSKKEIELSKAITDNKDIVKIIVDSISPKLMGDEEIYMVNDIWFQLNIKDKSKEEAILLMKAVSLNQELMDSALERLEGRKGTISINDLAYNKDLSEDENLIKILARNISISGIEGTLRGFNNLAGEKGETIEELAKRLAKNSTK